MRLVPSGASAKAIVDQSHAEAGQDIIGRDKIENNYYAPSSRSHVVDQLLEKLRYEIDNNEKARDTVESLAHYFKRKSLDGIDGLEAKLIAAKRSDSYIEALEQKEEFSKLLEKWSLYGSAQEIFAYLLARAEYQFNYFIRPDISNLSLIQLNQVVDDRIIVPTVEDCGASVFVINHRTAMGMIYWLAEQCYIRWHK